MSPPPPPARIAVSDLTLPALSLAAAVTEESERLRTEVEQLRLENARLISENGILIGQLEDYRMRLAQRLK